MRFKTKEMLKTILWLTIVSILIIGMPYGIVKLLQFGDDNREKHRQERKDKLIDCTENRTNQDLEWCIDNFN